jgi:hypothetical protein
LHSQLHHNGLLYRLILQKMALQRPGIFCLIVLLAVSHASNRANAEDADDTLQYTEKFLTSKIGHQMMHIDENMKAAMSGALKPQAVQSPKKVRSCRTCD